MDLEGTTMRSLLVEEMPDINGGDTPIPSGPSSSSTTTTAVLLLGTFESVSGSFSFGSAYSVFASTMTIGGMLGAVVSGKIVDLIGRRGAMWFCDIFITVGWLAILFAKDIWWLDLGRLTIGFGFGILTYVSCVYVAEITPKNIQGGFTSANQLMVCGGISLMFFIGNISTWRTLAIFELYRNLSTTLQNQHFERVSAKICSSTHSQFGGTNAILYYASSIFEAAGCSASFGTTMMAIIQVPKSHVSAAGTCLGNILVGLAFVFQVSPKLKSKPMCFLVLFYYSEECSLI
ncbi:hypothetical protein HYC85_009402 [Camellia sinensis]|uniref:Major facilitator superfamily (MFS) profile domain-containing protein n=1 Tax=Camellia sinensis TaxID=4442 RepID=A0A7J7HHI6_CAMSI|nr:hypothetical protein HYC85_009402 [Camellia sinensis]